MGCVSVEGMNSGGDVSLESGSSSVGKDLGSLVEVSDGSGSVVEGPPLSVVPWGMVLDSGGVLMSSNMLSSEECLVGSQS